MLYPLNNKRVSPAHNTNQAVFDYINGPYANALKSLDFEDSLFLLGNTPTVEQPSCPFPVYLYFSC